MKKLKQTLFALTASALFLAPAFATPALAADNGGVVHNVTRTVNSVIGGAGVTGGGSSSLGASASTPGGVVGLSTGIDLSTGRGTNIVPGGDMESAANGFYIGAQSDSNGFMTVQVTKTLIRF